MHDIQSDDKETIQKWDSIQQEPVTLEYALSGEKTDQYITEFLTLLTRLSSKITLKKRENSRLPRIIIKDNIVYSAVPLENELNPFLEALSYSRTDYPEIISQTAAENLQKLSRPATLRLYVARQCPHCPNMVRNLIPLGYECDSLFVHILDPTIFTEAATSDSVMSVPCLILDNELRWTGNVSPEEIIDVIVNRDGTAFRASSLKTILEAGNAAWITRQMIEKNSIFPGFVELLAHEKWPVRLGAIVVAQELAEKSGRLAKKIPYRLWEKFNNASKDVKGDILFTMGETGDGSARRIIEKAVLSLDDRDLLEAAREALDAITSRGS